MVLVPKKIVSTLIALTLLFPFPLHADGNPYKITPELKAKLEVALEKLYNLDYDRALKDISALKHIEKEHPMIAFGTTIVHWWRLSVYVLEPDPEESKPFLDAVEHTINISQDLIEKGDPTGEAHLAIGGALGLQGRWEATNRNWLSAYFKGKRAVKYLRRGVEINPNLYDAYMGLGIFDYYVATLPAVVRLLAFLGSDATAEKGIKELYVAAENGLFSSVPSKIFLADIFSHLENKPDLALEILWRMQEDYPNSPMVQLMLVIALYNHDRINDLSEQAWHYENQVNSGNFVPHSNTQAQFCVGLSFFKVQDWDSAMTHFNTALSYNNTKDAFYVFSMLHKGYALDALGRRKDAVRQYKNVLKQLRRWHSHENARKRLRKPFSINDIEMKTLKL